MKVLRLIPVIPLLVLAIFIFASSAVISAQGHRPELAQETLSAEQRIASLETRVAVLESSPYPTNTPRPVIPPTPTQEIAPDPGGTTLLVRPVSAFGVNVRSGPGTNYPVTGSVRAGDTVEICANGWQIAGSPYTYIWHRLPDGDWAARAVYRGIEILETIGTGYNAECIQWQRHGLR